MAKKKEKRTNFLDFSLCKRKRDFLLLTKGKAPLTFFFSSLCAAAAARLGGARSAAFLLPLPATNEASQPAPIRANFFPVRLEPAGRRGVVPPLATLLRPAPGWEKPGCPQRTTFWFPL